MLGYLAVAHYGRGRGEWAESEHPAFWNEHVDAVTAERSEPLAAILKRREAGAGRAGSSADEDAAVGALAEALQPWFEEASAALLARLYPDAERLLGSA